LCEDAAANRVEEVAVPGVVVVSVPVTDQDRAAKYYTDYLGFRVLRDDPMGPTMRWVQLASGDDKASLTLTTWFEKLTPGTLEGMVLHVEDPDALRARMVGDGHDCSECEDQPWGRFFMTKDPDGNGLVLTRTPD
jgi:catechol 2,3-dioxygenase-like lactoylglutathione lyase family enzyme